MAVKIDRETLAITTLVGAMMIYFFTRKEEAPEDEEQRRHNEVANELEQALNGVAAQYDALRDDLYGVSTDAPLDDWLSKELNDILKSCHQLRQNAEGNSALVEEWFTRLDEVVHGAQGHLRSYAKAEREKEAFKAHNDRQGSQIVHQTLNVTKNILNQQNVDRRSVSQHQAVDNRKFAQIHQRVLHMPQNVTPLGNDAFVSGGMSGAAAIRDAQQHNSLTTTNVVEQARPVIPGEGTWNSAQRLIEPAIVLPNDHKMRIEAPPATDNMNSAPAPVNDNSDNPPAQLSQQVTVHSQLQAPVAVESFNQESDALALPSTDPLAETEYRNKIAEIDGLIDSYAAVPLPQKSKREYVGQKVAIEALFLQYDKAYNEGPHANAYYTARQRWVGRMADIADEVSGKVRMSKEGISQGEAREGRREKQLKDRKKLRENQLAKRRTDIGLEKRRIEDKIQQGLRDRSAERERAFEAAVQRGEVSTTLESPELPTGRKRSASAIDLTGGLRRLMTSDFIQ